MRAAAAKWCAEHRPQGAGPSYQAGCKAPSTIRKSLHVKALQHGQRFGARIVPGHRQLHQTIDHVVLHVQVPQ
jgi:hypothetical protein